MRNGSKKRRFVELRARGESIADICKEIGVSRSCLVNWSKELVHEIANLAAIEYEAFCNEYQISRQHRIKIVATHLSAITKELLKRDFSKVPTQKLVEIQAKLRNELKEAEPQVEFNQEVQNTSFDILRKAMRRLDTWKA